MNYKRAIIANIASYIATLFIGSVWVFVFGIEFDPSVVPSAKLLLMSMILAIALTGAGAVWYFRSNNVKNGAMQGLLFGIVAILVGIMMDGVVFLFMYITGGHPMQFFSAAYHYWFFTVMLAIALIITTLIGIKSQK